jgi:hypothetical protein
VWGATKSSFVKCLFVCKKEVLCTAIVKIFTGARAKNLQQHQFHNQQKKETKHQCHLQQEQDFIE